ncbi:leucine-rich repeat domain-containing protein, partial [Asaia prunellae]
LETTTEKLTIPTGITEVAQNAAVGSYLKQLDLNQTKIIGNNAFHSCSALESVKIGKDVNKIGQGAFTNCQFIEAFVVDEQNSNYVEKDGVIFTKDGKNLLLYPCGKKNDYTVPEGTIKIEDFAFSDVQNLENVTIAKTVKTICPSAFKGAKILKKVDFQGTTNLETIGDHAFQNTKLE